MQRGWCRPPCYWYGICGCANLCLNTAITANTSTRWLCALLCTTMCGILGLDRSGFWLSTRFMSRQVYNFGCLTQITTTSNSGLKRASSMSLFWDPCFDFFPRELYIGSSCVGEVTPEMTRNWISLGLILLWSPRATLVNAVLIPLLLMGLGMPIPI